MFDVDRKGLRQLLERRGKEFALLELLQNAWDEDVTRVDVTFTKEPGERRAFIRVVDNSPNGFADLRHAYTLFASSAKKANPRQRGRFNIGEKLVIALCECSRIMTTTGAFEFVGNDRKTLRGKNTERGSIFEGEMILTVPEFQACCKAIQQVIPPPGIDTYFNGDLLYTPTPIKVVEGLSLRTEIADEEGYLRPTTRKTTVNIYDAHGEPGMLYELGIPVVETGDDYHVDVQQKIPLTTDRDNVTPSYLKAIRAATLNAVSHELTDETVTNTWVTSAMEDPSTTDETIKTVIEKRFGEKTAIFDPSDLEANNRATAAGFTVIHGRSMSGPAWDNIRRAGFMQPAGRIFPTFPADRADDVKELTPNATELKVIEAIHRIAKALLGFDINIRLVSSGQMTALATYGRRTMTFNKFRLGGQFLMSLTERVVDITVHELGHEFESNHLSDDYNNALTRLAAKLAFLVAADPTLLQV